MISLATEHLQFLSAEASTSSPPTIKINRIFMIMLPMIKVLMANGPTCNLATSELAISRVKQKATSGLKAD